MAAGSKTTNQQKYESSNPLRKLFLRPFQQRFLQVITDLQPTDLLEVGAGEGFLLEKIHHSLPTVRLVGLDVEPEIVAAGQRIFPHLDLRQGDIYKLNEPSHSWDVVVASEVLEHLDRPGAGLAELKRVAKQYVVLSVPWEPGFRLLNFARGKHLRRWGNHPEHINNWTQQSFKKFVSSQLTVERVIPSFPWTIIVAKV